MSQRKRQKQEGSWQIVAEKAQAYRDATISRIQPAIPELPQKLPENVIHIPQKVLDYEEYRITQMLPESLLGQLKSGKLSATTVITAYLRRAGLAQKLVCWVRSTVMLTIPTMI